MINGLLSADTESLTKDLPRALKPQDILKLWPTNSSLTMNCIYLCTLKDPKDRAACFLIKKNSQLENFLIQPYHAVLMKAPLTLKRLIFTFYHQMAHPPQF